MTTDRSDEMAATFDAGAFLVRWVLAVVLVFGTYNPTVWSYFGWLTSEGFSFGPVALIVGLLLLIGWIVLGKWTFDAIGWLGVILGGALFGAIIWWLVDVGVISMESRGALTWLALVVVTLILAIGMSWSHIKRRMSGQLNVDDVED
jgi:hypothetical protein